MDREATDSSTRLLLAIETSARTGSVALKCGDAAPDVRWLSADRRHTAELLPAMRALLAERGAGLDDVEALAWSCGPGSFTGLRMGATVARMAASAAGCRVVSVPTLDVIARGAAAAALPPRLAVILNAQAGRVYGAVYERRPGRPDGTDETIVRVQDAAVHDDPGAWLASLPAPFAIVGEGIEAHRAACEASGGVITPPALWTPSAAAVAEIGAALAAAGHDTARGAIVPLYLRPPACEEVYEQRRAAARARREQSQG